MTIKIGVLFQQITAIIFYTQFCPVGQPRKMKEKHTPAGASSIKSQEKKEQNDGGGNSSGLEKSNPDEKTASQDLKHNEHIAGSQELQEQLNAKEQELRNYIGAIAVSNAAIEFDLEGYILGANENFLGSMGYAEKELIGKHHRFLVEKEYADSPAYQLFWNALKEGNYQKDEFKYLDRKGKPVWLLGSYNPILDTSGRPCKILKLATDVTLARTRFLQLSILAAEKEKHASELFLANKELAFQNKEKENRAAELIIANKELEFQNIQKEERARELVIANKELAIEGREKQKRANELILANKKLAIESIQKEKRKAEKEKRAAELIVTNRELAYQEKRGKELMLANDELKKAQEELGAFSYSVSHDLRAPIRAINGYTQILLEDYADSVDENGKKVLQAVIQNSRKMGLLIDDLLAFSKLGRKQVNAAPIDMKALLEGVVADMMPGTGNVPVFEIGELAPANGDAALIRQVWVNLLSNAIKYSQYKSEIRITISSAPRKDMIVYCVKDRGAGFDMEYYDKLFGVFQRLHSQEEFDGTGIGLAIVQKIITRHAGSVWARSKLNIGSSFYFSLPAITTK